MDLDQSFLSELPLQHRQKVCKQIRQKQIEKYVTFIHSERGRELEPRKTNKKRANVRFSTDHLLQNAIDEGDDLQVVKYLQEGGDPNFFTGNGTTLLHKCAMEDNVSAADMLVQSGADVNVVDDDWWTPLHTACSCDSVEVAQLLLNNCANVAAIDVDGFFPLDLAAEGAEVKSVMQRHLEQIGMTVDSLHQHRQIRPRDMLNNIKGLPLAADINQLNEEGVSLLHIAAANGYRSCLKALFKYNVDVNRLDWYGWTPLHVAARYNQLRSIEVLLKKKANPNIVDSLGSKPSAVTCSDEIRAILIKAERKCQTVDNSSVTEDKDKTNLVHSDEDISDHRESVYDEIEDVTHLRPLPPGRPPPPPPPTVFRINSKTVRTRHVTISKEDELQEAKAMYEYVSFSNLDEQEAKTKPRGTTRKVGRDQFDDKKETAGESMYEPVAIWKSGGSKKGKLTTCSTTDNLITLTTIKDEAVLKELQVRYEASQIYTLIGDVLIAVNPFRDIEIYSKDISEKYHSRDPGIPLPPHIYEIAENSYQALLRENQTQCHVISGESGSGKTESCKLIVQHLLRDAGSEETQLSAKINQVNPLIEAFGNAITLMNNNSSRYGKYVELNFNKNGKVVGANISEYLLEKSRVVHRGGEECNFHIFYWMNAGLSPEEVSLYKLQNMDRFRYLSGTKMDPSSSNKAKFWEVKDCLKYIGFSTMDITSMLQILSIVLHLGEISFKGVGNNDAAVISNQDQLQCVADMLEVSGKELGSALVADYTMTRGEQIKKERTVERAVDCRDALAKTLYARLFSWIVNGINQLIQPGDQGMDLQIGILDIFGFENFPVNSFEQMCINVANEQIQLYANENIFNSEQQDCLLEGVPLVDINYVSNQEILDVFLERPTGLLAILDEESSFPKATDKSLASKLHSNVGKKHGRYYKTPRDGGLCFTMVHYAGCVTYDVRGILEKNRDMLPNSVLYTMKTSNKLLIKELFQSRVTRTGSLAPSARQQRSCRATVKKSSSPFEFFRKLKGGNRDAKKPNKNMSVEKKGPSTMAYHFRNSLTDLINKLQAAKPHFVRCIKPNTSKEAFKFVPDYVLAQLRYTGISETVKIRKFGYALRVTYHEFLVRYAAIVACSLPSFCPSNNRQKCELVVLHLKLENVQFGKTKVFFKLDHVTLLNQKAVELEYKVTKAQSVVRGFLGRQVSKRLSVQREQERQLALKQEEIKQITKSLEGLDDIISEYDTVFISPAPGKGQRPPPPASKPPPSRVRSQVTTDTEFPAPPPPLVPPVAMAMMEDMSHVDPYSLYDDAVSTNIPGIVTAEVTPQPARSPMSRLNEGETTADLCDDAVILRTASKDHDVEGTAIADDMNGHIQQRSLPPTPTHQHVLHFDPSRPPPSPREMYTQGMYPDQVDHRKQAPPPPRRNPETRLSTSQQGTYDDVEVEHGAPHQYYEQQQQQYYQQQISQQYPGHPGNQSPRHVPQSPGSSRPFSYGAPGQLMSPKSKPADRPVTTHIGPNSDPNEHYLNSNQAHYNYYPQGGDNLQHNGQGHLQDSPVHFQGQGHRGSHGSPTTGGKFSYGDASVHPASPAMQYGKTESVFQPQPHTPPPHRPPPPPPGAEVSYGVQGQPNKARFPSPHNSPRQGRRSTPSMDVLPRQQSYEAGPCLPELPQRYSQRSQSVPYSNDNVHMMHDNYSRGNVGNVLLDNRSESPPLPPPPPELLEDFAAASAPVAPRYSAHSGYVPPPLPPQGQPAMISSHHHLQQQQYQQQQQQQPVASHHQQQHHHQQPAAPPPPPLTSIPKKKNDESLPSKGDYSYGPGAGVTSPGIAAGIPPAQRAGNSGRRESDSLTDGIMQEISKVQLKKTEGGTTPSLSGNGVAELSRIQLRQTSTRLKLLERDGIKTSPEEAPTALEIPPAKPLPAAQPGQTTQFQTTPDQQTEIVSPAQAVNLFEKKAGKGSKDSAMEISLDDIDVSEIPGYIPVTKSTPIWKRDMIEKKNQEKLEEYIAKKKREKEEAEKWKNVPAWKRKLLVEKAKESDQKSEEEMKKKKEKEMLAKGDYLMKYRGQAADEEANRKRRAKEAEEERKARIKEQQEMEKKMQEEMQELPEWKREIMMKRGGAIKNWADEREGQNDQEIAEQERLAAEEEARAKPPSPVPQQAKSPAQPSKHVEPSKHVAPTKHVPNTTIPVQGSGGHVQNSPAAQPAKKQAAVKADTDNQVPKVFAQKATLVLKQQNQPDVVKSSAPPPSVDEGKLEEDWDSLPLWKREIMMKRGGAIKNWGDEREQVNVQGE